MGIPGTRPCSRWTRLRFEQHQARFPPEERRERNREAQARYREAHADRLRTARQIANILLRQNTAPDDIQALAAGLRQFLNEDGIRELRRELAPRKV